MPPAAPSALTATALSSTDLRINWTDNANNETQFKIERKTGAGGTYAQIATVNANVTIYTNTGLSPSTQYYFRVRANNSGGNHFLIRVGSNVTLIRQLGFARREGRQTVTSGRWTSRAGRNASCPER